MTNAFDSMDLTQAYEIAGGYIDADDATYEKALEMVRADDARFAEELKKAREAELALKAKQEKEEEITASAEETLANAEFIKKEFENKQFKQRFFEDEEIKEAEANTVIYDVNEQGDERFELEGEEKHKHYEMLFEAAKLNAWREKAGSKEFAEAKDKEKRKSLFEAVKHSFLGTIAHLRTAAQVEKEVPELQEDVKNNNRNSIATKFSSMVTKLHNALDFKKKIKVSSSSVMAACAESEGRTGSFAKKLASFAKKASGHNKECFAKVSIWTHEIKNAFKTQAKAVWGQRYEIMANIRDRAPKIITNIAATSVLVGATATSAPWLSAAVIGYGAYKASSAWVWPIITNARKEARLAKKDPNAPKIKFWDRLKQSASTLVKTKAYYKEAAWGSAAGFVGLGAAGSLAMAGSGALIQKSMQSMSSAAVYAANSLTNAVKKLREKDSNVFAKGAAVVGAAITTAVLVSCGENAENAVRMPQHNGGLDIDAADTVEKLPSGLDNPNAGQPKDTTAVTEVVQQAETPKITIPENWDENMGITEAQWTRLQSFWGSKEKYDAFYQKITDDMLKDGGIFAGKTREQVLFQYERLSSWDLTQHKEVISKLDSFFDCGGELTVEDTKALNDVLPNGAIKDINGTLNVQVTGREIDCGEDPVIHTVETTRQDIPPEADRPDTPVNTGNEEKKFTLSDDVITATETRSGPGKISGAVKYQYITDEDGNMTLLGDGEPIDLNELDKGSFDQNPNIVLSANGDSGVRGENSSSEEISAEGIRRENTSFKEISPEELNHLKGATADASDQQKYTIDEESTVHVYQGASDTTGNDDLQNEAVTDNATYTEQIVSDSDDIAKGTPAADNVPERGGYMNTGLTETQYHRLETFFKDQFGENAFDALMDKIPDEMRAKGGVFEGLSKAQSLFAVQQMVAWSNDQHGEFSQEITAMMEYLKDGCKDTLTAEESAAIKKIMDDVNENGTINGITGSNNNVVKYYQTKECSEPGVYNIEEYEGTSKTPSFGDKLKRFFKQLTNPAPEPFTLSDDVISVTHVKSNPEPEIVGVRVYDYTSKDGTDIELIGKGKDMSLEELNEQLGKTPQQNPRVVLSEQGFRDENSSFEEITVQDGAPVTPTGDAASADEAPVERNGNAPSGKEEAVNEQPVLSDAAKKELIRQGRDPGKVPPAMYKYLDGMYTSRN